MKLLGLSLIVSILFSGCTVGSSASRMNAAVNSPTPPVVDSNMSNANNFSRPAFENVKIDKAKREELEVKNAQFRVVPKEFKNVDFKNFRFRNLAHYRKGQFIKLTKGEFELEEEHLSHITYSLGNVFYVDLVGDKTKEAVVFIGSVSCGGSCDGGSSTIYFYSVNKGDLSVIGAIPTGSTGYGCSVRSFAIKDKTISVEQFGRCTKYNGEEAVGKEASSKFVIKDLTRTVYYFQGSKLKRRSRVITETPETNVMNYSGEISIDN